MSINLAVVTRNLFPTPVAAVLTPDADARNAELRTLILDRRRTARSMAASNAGGWHPDRDLLAWGDVRAAEVVEMARAVATQLTRDRDGREVRPTWVVSAWANVNGPGDSNFCHYHPGSFWSGAYYVDDGGVLDDPSLGGGFEMLDPRGTAPAMLAPTLAFAGEGGLAAGMTETIAPRPGLLFLFPSWLQHQCAPAGARGSAFRSRSTCGFRERARLGSPVALERSVSCHGRRNLRHRRGKARAGCTNRPPIARIRGPSS